MKRAALDIYDEMPKAMRKYISNYGWHFNKAAYEYAVSLMKNRDNSKAKTFSKEQVDKLFETYNIELENKIMYDYVFMVSLTKSKYYGSSIKDEKSLALFVKDTIDDETSSDDHVFRKWLATMVGSGTPIDWSEIC